MTKDEYLKDAYAHFESSRGRPPNDLDKLAINDSYGHRLMELILPKLDALLDRLGE